jgi:hypothetical protein
MANEQLDKAFEEFPSKKLRSHVWSVLPLGLIERLSNKSYYAVDEYGPNTKFPEIRRAIQQLLIDSPSEPFREFLYYTLGQYQKALEANPSSIIASVVRYAIAYKILGSILQDARHVIKDLADETEGSEEPVNDAMLALNQHPDWYGNKPLAAIVPNFDSRATAARPYFEAVMQDKSSVLRDDAAYMLGWPFCRGSPSQARGSA